MIEIAAVDSNGNQVGSRAFWNHKTQEAYFGEAKRDATIVASRIYYYGRVAIDKKLIPIEWYEGQKLTSHQPIESTWS